ncbi:uncharacterized protein K02A2.6-like, partial [Aedes albopictus]|uniref:Peptidase A2 domain-containing protein n=1 Tax=Aedes albopictus TaxID=7160 RepID=A0ABM1YSU0_AEDAL
MSVIGVHPPQFLNLSSENLAEAFRDFRQSWDIFVVASEIEAKPDNIKVALLKNFLGLDAVKVLDTLLPVADQVNPGVILNALGGYCLPQTNETYERFVFNTAVQRESEEVIEFVSRLRKLSVSCNFGNLKDSMIRDRIVVGIRSDDTRKALLKTVNLTLAGAIDICRAQKLVDDRLTAMKVKQEPREPEGEPETIAKCKVEKSKYRERVKCKYCGRDDYKIGNREECPANGVTCRSCGKQNHYARVCRMKPEKKEESRSEESRNPKKRHTKKVDNIEESDSDSSDYVANVEEVNVVDKKITTEISFSVGKSDEAKKIRCQVDTGASCNVITLHALKYITGGQTELEPSDTKLKGFGGQMVPAVGKSVLRHRGESKRFRVAFQVVDLPPKILPMPLLGYKTCIALGIVSIKSVKMCDEEAKRESVINEEADEVVERFSDVIVGDGKLKGKVNIELNDELPRVQEPRRVPVQVRGKLISELENLEKRGLIEKVNEPTEWTSNIVIVMRKDKIRICLDPTDLNRAIRRPRYQMATLEEILPDLKDAKVFSTLDVRNGFWHVELTDSSSRLTAFWTPEGSSNCKKHYMGWRVLVDDILCVGRGKTQQEATEDHNKNLAALLQRCQEKGIKLNRNKMKLNQTEVRFFGHILSKEGLKPDPLKTSAIQEMPEPKNVAELHRFRGAIHS